MQPRGINRQQDIAVAILKDCRNSDSKRSLQNDITVDFIRSLVKQPCSYCGETELRISLDRIDNAIGHLISNVVAACERCNYLRRDMPYETWLVVAVGMRAAREGGLFGAWTGGIHRRVLMSPPPPPAYVRSLRIHGTLGGHKFCGPPRCELCKKAMREWKAGRRKALGRVGESGRPRNPVTVEIAGPNPVVPAI